METMRTTTFLAFALLLTLAINGSAVEKQTIFQMRFFLAKDNILTLGTKVNNLEDLFKKRKEKNPYP